MSAIAGIYNINKEQLSPDLSKKIVNCFLEFPSDTVQEWCNSSQYLYMSCMAQWLTPESIGEKLPFHDSSSNMTIVADAIIDNRSELFNRLGVRPKEQQEIPDSQLILRAYQKWGENAPSFLIGDFAFMIWDPITNQMFGARDFSGSRTLYYNQKNNIFSFCTLIKPLFALKHISKELNEQWLAEFMAISGMIDTVDASITPYLGIEQLPPSHIIKVIDGKIKVKKYKSIQFGSRLKLKTDDEYIEAFQEVFQEAVNSRVRTHLNVGAQLSGGLDSGSIVAFARKRLQKEDKTLHTFSYIPSPDFVDFTPSFLMPNETPFIRSTVKHVGGIKDKYLHFDGRDSLSEMNSFLETMEMPYKFFENSFWLEGMFEEARKENVGILLNGGRGNITISWGSAMDYYGELLKKVKWIQLFNELNYYSRNVGGPRLRRIPYIAKIAFPYLNLSQNKYVGPSLINNNFAAKIDVYHKLNEFGMDESGWFASPNIYQQRLRHFQDDFHWNASNTLAAKQSIKYALWKRDPSNDLRVVNFCLSVPEDQYVQKGQDRALIRRATKGMLPENIRINQRIRGVQGADWVHRLQKRWEVLLQYINEMLNDEKSMYYLNQNALYRAYENMKLGVQADYVLNPDSKLLMRGIIIHRFLKQFN